MRRDRQSLRQSPAMQRHQHVDGGFVARFDRRRRVAVDDAHLAEILHDDEAARRIGVQNLRRRQVAVAQAARQRHIGDRILGQMGDGAIGLAVAHRRAVGPRRRVHQDHGFVVEREALENARRGVALHALAPRRADAGFVEEGAHQRDALGARRKGAVADIADIAGFGAELRRQRKGDVETVGRQQAGGAVGPFQAAPRRRPVNRRSRARPIPRCPTAGTDRRAPAGSAAAHRSGRR